MPRRTDIVSDAGLKTATKLLLGDIGGIEAAASCTRVGKSQIAEYASRNHSGSFMPIDVLADLEAVGGTPRVTAALARGLGFDLVPLQACVAPILPVALAQLGQEVGSTFAAAADALADHVITPSEREVLLHRLSEVRRAAAAAMAALSIPGQENG